MQSASGVGSVGRHAGLGILQLGEELPRVGGRGHFDVEADEPGDVQVLAIAHPAGLAR